MKILKWFALGVVALFSIALVVNAVLNSLAIGRLEKKVTVLRNAGQPVALAGLAHASIPPEKNAATYLRRAQSDVNAIQKEVTAAVNASPKADQDAHEQGRLSPELKTAIQSAFAAYPNVIRLIEQAADSSDYDPQFDLTTDPGTFMEGLLADVSAWRQVMRLLKNQALLQIADGQQEQALQTSLLMFRLFRHLDNEPMIIGYLVSTACRGIAISTANLALRAGPVSDASRDALEAALARYDSVQHFQNSLRTERAYGLQSFRDIGVMMNLGPFGLPWIKDDAGSYLDVLAEVIANADCTYAKAIEARKSSSAVANAGMLTRMTIGSLQPSEEAAYRIRAQLGALRVLNTLGRLPEAQNDEAPKLANLGLPPAATTDPFDGQPLRLKKLPGGWVVYSVGKNLQDDGGNLDPPDQLDVGLGPASTTATP